MGVSGEREAQANLSGRGLSSDRKKVREMNVKVLEPNLKLSRGKSKAK